MRRPSFDFLVYLDKGDETREIIKMQCKICLSKES